MVTTTKPRKGRKPKTQLKQDQIRVRMTAEEKRTLIEAANLEGFSNVSGWLRAVGLREARRVIKSG